MLDMVPWEKINDFLLKIETCEDVGVFADTALKSMGELVYFDKGLAYILNGAGAVVGEKYCNFQQQVSEAYLEYYSKLDIPRSPGRDWKRSRPGWSRCCGSWTGPRWNRANTTQIILSRRS